MNAFMWSMVVLLLLSVCQRLWRLVCSEFTLTPNAVAGDLFLDVAFVAWAMYLLGGGQ